MPRRLASLSSHDSAEVSLLPHGSRLDGRFELLQLLGRGGMGTVYRARDLRDGGVVAIKILTIEDTSCLRRFRREFKAVSRLAHHNVVTVHSFHAGPPPYFSMEYVPGEPLTRSVGETAGPHLNDSNRLGRVRAGLRQLLEGLAHIHAHGLVHRDLKPENILVTADGRLRIMDFGVVRGDTRDRSSGSSSGGLTQGRIVGTLAYMSPEQLEGLSVDARSDLYSVGAVLYELLTGEPPFNTEQFGSLARAILHDSPPLPQSLNPGVDPILAAFAMTLLEKKPWQRLASAEQALAILESKSEPPTPGPSRPLLLAPQFAGREIELATIAGSLSRLESDGSGPLVITGVGGIGKTHLLAEAAALARGRGLPVLHLRPPTGDGALARALLEAIGRLDPKGATNATPRAMAAMLGEISRHSGLVLLLDDVDRLDTGSQRLLAELARELWAATLDPGQEPRVLLIITATESASPNSDALRVLGDIILRQRIGTQLSLASLNLDETEAMVRSMLGETRLPAALAHWVHQETGGNPLFVEETVRHLVLGGWLVAAGGKLTLNWSRLGRPQREELQVGDFDCLPVARGVRDLILAGLSRLGAEARNVASVASLAGPEVDFDTLQAATGLEEEALADAIEDLLEAHVLVRADAVSEGWRFAHHKAREVLAAEAAPAEASRIHAALARALEAATPEQSDPVALARHYDAAGLGTDALRHLPAAAAALSRAQSHAESAEAWSRYLELIPADQRGGNHAGDIARRQLAHELSLIGRVSEAKVELEALLASHEHSPERSDLLRELIFLDSRLGNFGAAVLNACELLAMARAAGRPADTARAQRVLGTAQFQHGHFADAERSFEAALALYRELGDRAGLAVCLRWLGSTAGAQGRLTEAGERLQAALAHLRGLGATNDEQSTVLELGTLHLNQGWLDRAIDCYSQALVLARTLALSERVAMSECNLGYALTLAGDYGEAEQSLARCLRYTADGRNSGLEAAAFGNRAMLRRHAGDFAGALSDARRARGALGDAIHPGFLIELDVERSRIEAALGRPAAARRSARSALALARGNHLPWHEAQARAALADTLEGPGGLAQARRARAIAQEMGAELLLASTLVREAALEEAWADPLRAREARDTARRILSAIGRRLGPRERMFLRTPLVEAVLGRRAETMRASRFEPVSS